MAIAVAVVANILPNQYITKTTAVASGSSGENGQMAGLAALAGISMSSGGEVNFNRNGELTSFSCDIYALQGQEIYSYESILSENAFIKRFRVLV